MRVGVYVYGLASAAAGVMDFIWGDFDSSHQPIQAFGDHIPGREILAYITAVWMIAGGAAILWRRSSGGCGGAGRHLFHLCRLLVASILYRTSRTWFSNSCLYRCVGWSRHTTHRGRRRSTRLRVLGNAQFFMAANDSYRSLDIWSLLNRLRLGAFDWR